jgi:hypothetical protein
MKQIDPLYPRGHVHVARDQVPGRGLYRPQLGERVQPRMPRSNNRVAIFALDVKTKCYDYLMNYEHHLSSI